MLTHLLCRTIGAGAKGVWLAMLLFIVPVVGSAQDSIPEGYQRREVVTEEVKRDEMRINFIVAKDRLEPNYMNNAKTLKNIVSWIDRVQRDSAVEIIGVEFCGSVSPEGSVRFNRWLSNARLGTLERYVRKRIDIPEDLIVRNDHYISWNELDSMVVCSDLPNKEAILRIIRSENRSRGEQLDSRIGDLKRMDGGKTWQILFDRYFRHMRYAYTVLVTRQSNTSYEYYPYTEPIARVASFDQPTPIAQSGLAGVANAVTPQRRTNMYVKTNLVGLAMLGANVGVEFDLGQYLSLSIPVSYSAINYFKPTTKFRHFSLQPELRVWPMKNYDRLFIGAHMGFAYYNYAFDGEWRYQDHDGKSPTLGGGLTIGYRLPISKDTHWKLELAVGAGIYPLYYDVFYNLSNVKDGQLHDTRRKTYIGLDNVTVGISYRIPLKKKYNSKALK